MKEKEKEKQNQCEQSFNGTKGTTVKLKQNKIHVSHDTGIQNGRSTFYHITFRAIYTSVISFIEQTSVYSCKFAFRFIRCVELDCRFKLTLSRSKRLDRRPRESHDTITIVMKSKVNQN